MLHIAIVRRLDRHIIQMFVESPQGAALLKQRAVGSFFKDPKLSDGCCNYGEFPLGFAACTNQKETFDYLVSRGASLSMTTYEGHNLLHLMVLHSKNKLRAAEQDGDESGEDGDYGQTSQWCKVMYDHIEDHLKRGNLLEQAMTQVKHALLHLNILWGAYFCSLSHPGPGHLTFSTDVSVFDSGVMWSSRDA